MKLDDLKIGPSYPCFIAAEIGINHNGDMNLAFSMIEAAKKAGASAVKFQNYYTEDFLLNKEITYTYSSRGQAITLTQYEMFKQYELSASQLYKLKEFCDSLGIIFFSTPTSLRSLQDLQQINVPLLKNGSDLLVNLDLITHMAKTNIPLVLSTGMATLAEIDEAVQAFEEAGGNELVILHCISSYPTQAEQVNLLKIQSLSKAFNYPVGFSDHTEGVVAALGAVTLGACFIEKHFTIDKSLPGPDHQFSCDFNEMKSLVDSIRFLEKSLGTSKIGPTSQEKSNRENFRISCVAKHDLTQGHLIQQDDIAFSRPGNGLPPKFATLLIGRKLNKNIPGNHLITFNDFL